MCLFELTLLFDQDRRCRTRAATIDRTRSRGCATLAAVERSAHELDQTIMIDVSRRSDDEVAVRELLRVKSDRGFVIKSRNGFARAFDRAPERLVRKVSSVEEF